MKKNGNNSLSIIVFIMIAFALVKCSKSFKSNWRDAQNDPRTKERIEQEREDLNNRLLDKHFEEDARRKR